METVVLTKGTISITERELAIVDLLSKGERTKTIANKLGISSRTVEVYVARLFDKFDATSQPHLVATLLRKNLIK